MPFQKSFCEMHHKGVVLFAADVLGYSFQETELFAQAAHRPGGSPTRDLLLNWSHRNPTVSDLYRHLVANKLNHAAAHLKDYGESQNARQPVRCVY